MLLHLRVDSHFAVRYDRARARLTKITLSIPIAPGGTVKQMKRFRTRFDLLTSFLSPAFTPACLSQCISVASKAPLDPYAILLRDSCNALQIIPMKLARICTWLELARDLGNIKTSDDRREKRQRELRRARRQREKQKKRKEKDISPNLHHFAFF